MVEEKLTLLVLTDGPVVDVGLPLPPGAPARWKPQTVIWVSRDAAGRTVLLGPDKTLLNLVAARSVNGLGWVPYRLADDEPLKTMRGDVWRYAWDRIQDPAETRGLRAVG